MDRPEPLDLEGLRRVFEERNVTKVKVGGFDIDGVLRGKYVSLDKFWSAARGGFGFCDVIFGWDIGDVLYDNAKVTGWHTGYPDAHGAIDLDDASASSRGSRTPRRSSLDFVERGRAAAHPACPRSLLKRVLARAASDGLRGEVRLPSSSSWSSRRRPSRCTRRASATSTPLTPGHVRLLVAARGPARASSCTPSSTRWRAFDMEIEGFHTETGPGVYEAAIRYDDALRAADKAALFKTQMKELAHRARASP